MGNKYKISWNYQDILKLRKKKSTAKLEGYLCIPLACFVWINCNYYITENNWRPIKMLQILHWPWMYSACNVHLINPSELDYWSSGMDSTFYNHAILFICFSEKGCKNFPRFQLHNKNDYFKHNSSWNVLIYYTMEAPKSNYRYSILYTDSWSQWLYCANTMRTNYTYNIPSHQCNKVISKKYIKVACAIVHKFAYIKTIECNNVVSSSIGIACSSWNFVKRYDLVALSKIYVCHKVVTMIRPCKLTIIYTI